MAGDLQRLPETSSNVEILKHAITINQLIGRYLDSGVLLDHGTLAGLSDDDHPHYYNSSRLATALSSYYTIASADATFAPLSHTHTTSDITNLSSYTGFDARYYTESEADALFAAISHTHASTAITDFAEAVDDRVAALLVAGSNITLTYNDGANTLTIAATGSAGSVATDAIWDAKGDLAVGSGADTAARLAAGADGTVLQARAGATAGVEWVQSPANATRLSEVILADSPMAYWKCSETSGTTLDNAQGTAAYDLTLSGSYTLAFTHLLPDSSEKYLYVSGGYAGVSGDIGFTSPVTGSWTFECVLLPLDFATLPIRIFTITATGETEPTNYQIYCAITTSGEVQVFWEYGAGVNVTNASGILMREGVKNHYAFVKDGTANTVTFFIDGSKVAVVSYTDEPSGGTDASIVTRIGADGTGGGTGNFVIGHAAIWASALTEAQILSHARAAGRA